ncbi:MAG: ABC transporter permease [bacterium]|nr:ABC transporter permease [bacterium]
MYYMKLAWRNLFRNKRRTIIASIAISIGLAALITGSATTRGMVTNIIKSATTSFLGEAEIHHNEFRESQEIEKTIQNAERVINNLKNEECVDKFTPRTLSMGMVTAPANVNAVILVGINPDSEKHLSKIDDLINKGEFFTGDNPRDIVIGSKLAGTLESEVGDRVVVTVAQAKTGALSQEMFRISGIYHFNVREMDEGMAFIRLPKAQQMLGIGKGIHQIALKFKNIGLSTQMNNPFWERYNTDGNEAVNWLTIIPQMGAIYHMYDFFVGMLVFVLAGVVLFGIINTLFMSLYERMFEFAVLRAVGTRSAGIRKLVIYEAGALAFLSIIAGTILAMLLLMLLNKTGIDYRGIEFAGATFHEILYPDVTITDYIYFPLGVFIFTLIVGIYPAWVAGKMKVAEALRKSL